MTSEQEKVFALWLARHTVQEEQLVAFVVAKANTPLDAVDLRHWLADAVPAYMLPTDLVVVTDLPRTPSGKLDRAALALSHAAVTPPRAAVAPRSSLEDRVAGLFQQVLGVRPVSVDDDFFAHLGGHSLVATQLASLVRRDFAIDFPLRIIFESPTVSGIAAYVQRTRQGTPARTTIARQPREANSNPG